MSEYALWQEEQEEIWRERLEHGYSDADKWASSCPYGDLQVDDSEEFRYHHEYDAHGKINPEYIDSNPVSCFGGEWIRESECGIR